MSKLEEALGWQMEIAGIPRPEREFRFDAKRRWRFDFAWPATVIGSDQHFGDLAIEVDGGTRTQGRHVRGSGYEADCEKVNEAQLQGWVVLRVTSEMVKDGRALRLVQRAFGLTPP